RGLDPEPPDRERRGRDVEERVTEAAVALVLALAPSRDESDRGFPELTVLCVLDPDPHRLASRITVRLEVEAGRFAAVRDCVSGVHDHRRRLPDRGTGLGLIDEERIRQPAGTLRGPV